MYLSRKGSSKLVAALFGSAVLMALFTPASGPRNEFEEEGLCFRERVVKRVHSQSATGFQPFIDLTPLCKSESFEGMPLWHMRGIIVGAGGKGLIKCEHPLSKELREANDAHYFGVFDAGSSLFGNVIFSMSFRAHQRHNVVVVSEITSCGISSAYF